MMFLPLRLSEPSTYTLRLTDAGISPCLSGAPDPADRGALVKLNYIARHPLNDGSGTLSPLVVFEGREIPVTINVTAGEWKEVRSGDSHGVYWRGGPYTDVEGTVWIGDVSVLVLERGDLIFTMIGQPGQGVTLEMLQSVVAQLEKEAAAAAAPPTLKWIEMRRNGEVISRKDDSAPEPLDCRTPTSVDPLSRRADVRLDSLASARQMVGFHALTLPVSGTLPANLFHFELKSVTVRACLGAELQPKDPGARLRQGFQGQTLVANTATQVDVSLFQQQQQPLTLNVTGGAWRAVSVGDWRGVYWQGSGFRDPSGIDWITDASVLMLERGNDVVTLAGRPDQGVTDELRVPLAAAMK
jgi:hypothetical protein